MARSPVDVLTEALFELALLGGHCQAASESIDRRWLHQREQRVAVAIQPQRLYRLDVAACFALLPKLIA